MHIERGGPMAKPRRISDLRAVFKGRKTNPDRISAMPTLLMPALLLILALSVLGVIVGIYVTGLIHDYRIGDLSASQYAAMHQMRDKAFSRVMPALGLGGFNLVLLAVLAGVAPGTARVLGLAAVLMLLADIALTIVAQLPLNQQIQGWAEGGIPADWAQARDRWARRHAMRAALGVSAYLCFAAAVILSV
jgi:uncharacterized membrane protein